MAIWFIAFLVLPAVELALLIQLGSRVGTMATLLLIVATGAVGAALARRQGLHVLRRIEREAAAGQMPALPLLHGVVLLFAAALLITPGILTDVVGFLLLMPVVRGAVVRLFTGWLEARVRSGGVAFDVRVARRWESPSGPTYDITPERRGDAESGSGRDRLPGATRRSEGASWD